MEDTEEWREKGEQCLGRRMSWSWDHGAVDTGLSLTVSIQWVETSCLDDTLKHRGGGNIQ